MRILLALALTSVFANPGKPFDKPDKDKVAEVGLFKKTPYPLASDSVELVLEAALRARRTGLR